MLTPIPTLPPAPARGEPPTNFSAKASAFVAALPAWGDAVNALAVEMQALYDDMEGGGGGGGGSGTYALHDRILTPIIVENSALSEGGESFVVGFTFVAGAFVAAPAAIRIRAIGTVTTDFSEAQYTRLSLRVGATELLNARFDIDQSSAVFSVDIDVYAAGPAAQKVVGRMNERVGFEDRDQIVSTTHDLSAGGDLELYIKRDGLVDGTVTFEVIEIYTMGIAGGGT